MGLNILFLSGANESDFYNLERNKYKNVLSTSFFKSNKKIIKIIRRIAFKMNIPFISLLYGKWTKDIHKFDLFIISSSIYSLKIINYIKKRSDKKIIYWYWNPIINDINPKKVKENNIDIWTFDKNDSVNYQLNYAPTYYFSNISLPEEEVDIDVFFIGADKGRLSKLIQLNTIFNKLGLEVNFHITKSKKYDDISYNYKKPIPYEEVLHQLSKSKAILDIVQVGQNGMTQRVMESIFFEKKLITNDKDIKRYDFYNPKNIFILDIDNINDLPEFIDSAYVTIDNQIVEKYDFSNWINYIVSKSV